MFELFVLSGAVQQAMLKNRILFPLAAPFLVIAQSPLVSGQLEPSSESRSWGGKLERLLAGHLPKGRKEGGGREKN